MSSGEVERKLTTILAADVVGYSRLTAADEEGTVRRLRAYREVVDGLVDGYHGRVFGSAGDSVVAEFPSAVEAVRCAVDVQRSLAERNADLSAQERMQFRIGVNVGDVMIEGNNLLGDGVNVAARLEGLAQPGGVCISGTVYDQVKNKLPLGYEDLGEQAVKNIPEPVRVYRVRADGETPHVSCPRRRPRPGAIAAVAIVAVTLLIAGGVLWHLRRPLPDSRPIRSLAVLPLENLSGDPEQEYFADGMTEALIGDLAKIGSLRVISRTSVMHYKGARKPLPEIARELEVDAVVEGTVLREGSRVRITAQLIDARADRHLWSERYDRDARNVLRLQSDVARSVAREIRHELSPGEEKRLSEVRAVDPQAHDAYLRGRYQYSRYTKESVRSAIRSYEAALEIDPSYAPAHAAIAISYFSLGFPLTALSPSEAMPRAKMAALRALELDENLGEAHGALGLVRRYYDWEMEASERDFERALELSPSEPLNWVGLPYLRITQGRHDEALELCRRAVAIAPLDPWQRHILSECFYFTGHYDEALAELQKLIELDEGFVRAYQDLCWVYATLGREADLLRARASYMRLNGYGSGDVEAMYRAYELEGMAGYWRYWLADPSGVARSEFVIPFHQARAHAALGEIDRAFEWLERTYKERGGDLAILREWPWTEPLRGDPRFEDLARRVGLPEGAVTKQGLPALPSGPTVAVLPFTNLSGDPEQEYFSDGLTEDIITELSRFRDLFVIARNSTFRYKGRAVDVREVHRDLGARYVLEGSVRRSGNALRISAQLIDAKDGTHLWAETYDRDLSTASIFAVQDHIAERVVGTIASRFGVLSRARFAEVKGKPTSSFTAYECVLLADAYYRDNYVRSEHEKVRRCLERAVREDPGYAGAWAYLTWTYLDEHRFGYYPQPDPLGRALRAAQRAVRADHGNQSAHLALAAARYYRHELDLFLAASDRAIGLNPNDALTLAVVGEFLVVIGNERGIELVRRAIALDPYHPTWLNFPIAYDHFRRKEYEQALLAARKIQIPGYFWPKVYLAAIYASLGREADAREAVAELHELYPGFTIETYRQEAEKGNTRPEDIEQWADALRQAGVPGEPVARSPAHAGRPGTRSAGLKR